MKLLSVFVLATFLVVSLAAFVETPFSAIENGPSNSRNIAYFYRSTSPASLAGLQSLEAMANLILKEFPEIQFFKCDGSLEENQALYAEAGFGDEGYTYLQMGEIIGMLVNTTLIYLDLYRHELNYDRIIKHLRSMLLTPATDIMMEFKHEIQFSELFQRRNAKPILVLFQIPVCAPCTELIPSFGRYADYYRNYLNFMTVNCEHDEESTAFCTKAGINSYPSLVLFKDAKKRVKLDGIDRTFTAVDKWLAINGIRAVGKAKGKEDL